MHHKFNGQTYFTVAKLSFCLLIKNIFNDANYTKELAVRHKFIFQAIQAVDC